MIKDIQVDFGLIKSYEFASKHPYLNKLSISHSKSEIELNQNNFGALNYLKIISSNISHLDFSKN